MNETITGSVTVPKMDGVEIYPGVYLIGEPTPIPGTNLFHCLANAEGALCVLELRLRFAGGKEETK
jgi:hypothetical protein